MRGLLLCEAGHSTRHTRLPPALDTQANRQHNTPHMPTYNNGSVSPRAPQPSRRLLGPARTLLAINALFWAADGLCSIFVNIYLWRVQREFPVLLRYNLACWVTIPPFILLAGWLAQARDRTWALRIGLALHAVFYLSLLSLREAAVGHVVPLGVVLGVAMGFYYAGLHTLTFDVTAQGERDYYVGLSSFTSGITGAVAPFAAGAVIGLAAGLRGYVMVFALAVVLYVVAFATSLRLPPDREVRAFRIRVALLPPKEHSDWRRVMALWAVFGGRFGIFMFIVGLLMYMASGSEMVVGGYSLVTGSIRILGSLVVGRAVTPARRLPFMLLGALSGTAAGLIMLGPINLLVVWAFGIMLAVSTPLFSIPSSAIQLDVIGRTAADPSQRVEYVCAREVPLAVGRFIYLAVLWSLYDLLTKNLLGLRIAVCVTAATALLGYFIMSRISFVREEAARERSERASPSGAAR